MTPILPKFIANSESNEFGTEENLSYLLDQFNSKLLLIDPSGNITLERSYVDASLLVRDVAISTLNSSVGSAIGAFATNASVGAALNLSLGSFATNASVGSAIGAFATNASVGTAIRYFATNSSVGSAISAFATNSSVGTAIGAFATNASVGIILNSYIKEQHLFISSNTLIPAPIGSNRKLGIKNINTIDISIYCNPGYFIDGSVGKVIIPLNSIDLYDYDVSNWYII
jgi:hypothetical protein